LVKESIHTKAQVQSLIKMCGHNPRVLPQPHNDVFAAYFKESDQFQLFQLEKDDSGKYARIKNYAKPDVSKWNTMKSFEKKRLEHWKAGQEWYVVPKEQSGNKELKVNQIMIHNQTYTWWSLTYTLVWSNYQVYSKRNKNTDAWLSSPTIPILEFNSKLIYPRTDAKFYANCPAILMSELFKESELGRKKAQELMGLLAGSPKEKEQEPIPDKPTLSIRTPRVEEEEHFLSDTDAQEEGRAHGRVRLDSNGYIIDQFDTTSVLFSKALVTFMVLSLIGLYVYCLAHIMGY
jgi:hypothetical protein